MYRPAQNYKGFTLIEMIVVLGIIILLAAISIFSFSSFRNTSLLRESTANLVLDIQNTQRAAMYLRRDVGERWLYGIGIDLGSLNTSGNNDYTIFRWCSQFDDFDPNGDIKMNSEFPNYDPEEDLTALNGNMPFLDEKITKNSMCDLCAGNYCQSELRIDPKDLLTTLDPLVNVSISTTDSSVPRYILFEAVSGRAFFYRSDGKLLNYNSSGNMVSTPQSVVLTLSIPGYALQKQIKIAPVSGRLTVTDL